MTRAEQVAFCRRCNNRGFDPDQGIICSLTNDIANFVESCPDFAPDNTVAEQPVTSYGRYATAFELPNLASKSQRFLNLILDFIAILAFSFFTGILLALIDPILIDQVPEILFSLLINLSFYCFFEMVFKQTPGKMITRTKVVSEDGNEVSAGQVFSRSICRFIPFEPFSFLGDGPGWHDSISSTRVIDLNFKLDDPNNIPLE